MDHPSANLNAEYEAILAGDFLAPPYTDSQNGSVESGSVPSDHEDINGSRVPRARHATMPPVLRRVFQIPKGEYGRAYDVVAAEAFQRRNNADDPNVPFRGYPLLERTVVDYWGEFERIQLEVQSPSLCQLLQNIGGHCRKIVNLDVVPIVFEKLHRGACTCSSYKALFFLLKPLEDCLHDTHRDSVPENECRLLVEYIKSEDGMKSTLNEHERQTQQGKITFSHLWTLFPPKALVYANKDGWEECFVVESAAYTIDELARDVLRLSLLRSVHSGDSFGIIRYPKTVQAFSGFTDITTESLPLVPMSYLNIETQEDIQRRLIDRGQKYVDFQSVEHMHLAYTGWFWALDSKVFQRAAEGGIGIWVTDTRVMVDSRAMLRLKLLENPSFLAPRLQKVFSRATKRNRDRSQSSRYAGRGYLEHKLSEEHVEVEVDPSYESANFGYDSKAAYTDVEFLVCPPVIACFLFAEQQWGSVSVDKLQEIVWNEQVFDRLQLDLTTKSTIRTLVTKFDRDSLLDFNEIQYKGRGIIFLLHGAPGLGKTFTAESVAECAHKPLYHITTGHLSSDVTKLEEKIRMVFELGSKWKAVVLLDEADVLMSKRTSNDLERNAIVAVFLRELELYRGLIFLTTNQADDIDEAFYNRIHIKVEYKPLTEAGRLNIWRQILLMKPPLPDEVYEILAPLELNGRDIRNIVRVLYSLGKIGDLNLEDCRNLVIALRLNKVRAQESSSRKIDLVSQDLESLIARLERENVESAPVGTPHRIGGPGDKTGVA